jgi:hypothetical protein
LEGVAYLNYTFLNLHSAKNISCQIILDKDGSMFSILFCLL